MSNVLPIIQLILAGGWNPDLLLSQSDYQKRLAKMTVRLQGVQSSGLEEIDNLYESLLPEYVDYEPYIFSHSSEKLSPELLNFVSVFSSTFTRTISASDKPMLELSAPVEHNYAQRFYDTAINVDIRHCLLWMKEEEARLKSDDDMKQLVRETMTVIVGYCKKYCMNPIGESEQNKPIYNIVLKKLTCLYFEIVDTYIKEHDDWNNYIRNNYSEQLPLEFLEFTSECWPEMPTEDDEEAWNNRFNKKAQQETTPNLPQLEGPKLTTRAEKFADAVRPYQFNEVDKVKALNPKQQAKLIEEIVATDKGCYAAAMLEYLGYHKWLKDVYKIKNEDICKHCSKAIGVSKSSYTKYYYSLKADKPYDTYEKHNSKDYIENGEVEKDYNDIKLSA